jgi:cytochrome b561
LALYALLIATPAVGIVLRFALGGALPIFGIAEIASPWVRDRAYAIAVKDIHETLANALMAVAAFHTAAALAHHWILRDRTLTRMSPFFGR